MLGKPPRGSPVWPRRVPGAQPRGDHHVPTPPAIGHLGVAFTPQAPASVVGSANPSFKTFTPVSVFLFRSLRDLYREEQLFLLQPRPGHRRDRRPQTAQRGRSRGLLID